MYPRHITFHRRGKARSTGHSTNEKLARAPAHNQTPHRQHYGILLRARDIIFLFAHTLLIADFNLEKEQDELRQIERTLVIKKGCKTNSVRYIIVATKEVEAFKRALQKLQGSEPLPNGCSAFLGPASFAKEGGVDGPGFEPGTSTMPTWRSCQADLPAH